MQRKKWRMWGCLALTIGLLFGGHPSATARDEGEARSDGAQRLEIGAHGSLQNPAWSPDGSALLLTRFVGGYNTEPADLLIFERGSGRVRVLLADGNANVNLPGAAWNATTGEIVFSAAREPHDEIYVIDAEGSPARPITHRAERMAYEPSWSPDGAWIVFEAHPLDEEAHGVITLAPRDGNGPYRTLTDERDDCRQPNWSPSGEWIVFQCFAAGHWDLWITHPDGSGRHPITTGPGDKTDASFSPDGRWVVYSGDADELEYANLFIVPLSGGRAERLTFYSGYDGAPAWSPDGAWVAFESAPKAPEDTEGTQLWVIAVPARFAPEPPESR